VLFVTKHAIPVSLPLFGNRQRQWISDATIPVEFTDCGFDAARGLYGLKMKM